MFTTFSSRPDQHSDQTNGEAPSSPRKSRPKRTQVARACNWCRISRVKCDNYHPCRNCRSRGGRCNKQDENEVLTLPSAIKEIDHLKAQVKKLKEQAKNHEAFPIGSEQQSPDPHLLDHFDEYHVSRKHWEGVWATSPTNGQKQYYGPSSTYYFIARMGSYLGSQLQQPQIDQQIQPNTASKVFSNPASLGTGHQKGFAMLKADLEAGDFLSRAQEDHFLSLFWQTYHCVFPILNETDFKRHYESLWVDSPSFGTARQQAPLVDIVLAICMQYGRANIPRSDGSQQSKSVVDGSDATIAGRYYYRRCQSLTYLDLENPSVTTLQCQLWTIVYLQNASFLNMAHSVLAMAIRTAHVLGIHLEPSDKLPRTEREAQKRLWWCLYALEGKACMSLGRPWLMQLSDVTCTLSADDQELGLLSGASNFVSSSENINWLSYHVQCVKLIMAARSIHSSFYAKSSSLLSTNSGKPIYEDTISLETLASFLSQALGPIKAWVQQVPTALQTPRRNKGRPFSTDRSPLDIDLFSPLWLQRQRLLLELLYHSTLTALYRPFIRFSPFSATSTPLADSHAIAALNHAIATTSALHQVLSETDILAGWHQACQYQWPAALGLLGFALAYPVCPPTPSALAAAGSAVLVFEVFGRSFAVARSAAGVTRELKAKAESLIARFRSSVAGESLLGSSVAPMSWMLSASGAGSQVVGEEPPPWDGEMGTMFSLLGGLDPAWQNADSATDTAFWASFIDSCGMESFAA